MAVRIDENQLKRELYRENTTLARNIRLLRILHGYNQQDMCDFLHLSRTSYFSFECGCRTPDFEVVCDIADFFNISLDYLVSFDIAQQLLNLLNVDHEDTNALVFIKKYLSLSHSGRKQINDAVQKLKYCESTYNYFPWKYENSIYERK